MANKANKLLYTCDMKRRILGFIALQIDCNIVVHSYASNSDHTVHRWNGMIDTTIRVSYMVMF